MKKISIYLIFISLLCMCSCNNKQEQVSSGHIISVFDIEEEDFNPQSVRVVPLQTSDSSLLGDRVKLIQLNDKTIYIGDFRARKKVLLFDKDGKFKHTVGQIGQGPKEYFNFSDFTVYNDTISVLSNGGDFSNICSYKKSGEFISSIKLDIGSVSFSRIGSVYLVNTSYSSKMYSHRLYAINLEGKKIASFLPYPNKKFSMFISERGLVNNNSQILYRQSFDRFAYAYKNGGLQQKYEFDFGKYAIPLSFYEDSFLTGFKVLDKNGFGTLRYYFESSKYTVFEVDFQKHVGALLIDYIVLNKETKQMERYAFTEKDNFLGQLVGISGSNELIFLTYPHQILDNMDKFKKYPISNKEVLQKIKIDDNPVLFYYTLKNE